MSSSRAFIMGVSSVNLVFGLDWFAILGGAAVHEVRRISRQNKATHAVYSGEGAASVGVTSFRTPGQRGKALYSAAQLVAQMFTTGTVAMVAPLGDGRWWLVAVHEGAVIARTDYVCTSPAETSDLVRQLFQAYPALTLLDDARQPSLTDLVAAVCKEALIQRVSQRSGFLPRPFQWFALTMILIFLVPRAWSVLQPREPSREPLISPDVAWQEVIKNEMNGRWVHGVSGTSDVLGVLYGLPVVLAGWRLSHAECTSSQSLWRCHADYGRGTTDANNEDFLSASHANWEVDFTPLEQVRVRWDHPAKGLSAAQAILPKGSDNERYLFSRLQAIRQALTQIVIAPSRPLSMNAPVNEQGHPVPMPPGLSQFGLREIQIRAPLRSVSLLLPYCEAIAWSKITMGLDQRVVPSLTDSRLNVTLQGVIYEEI